MPCMDWNAPDLSETFALFQQQMRLYFSVRNIKIDKQFDIILLTLAANGLQIYNSWSLDSSENNTDKFVDAIKTIRTPCTGLAKFDWKVVAQWATKDINLVAQQ